MKTFRVEKIINRNEFGEIKYFKTESAARKYAVKASKEKSLIETFLCGEDDNDMDFEVMEYYSNGVLTCKVA